MFQELFEKIDQEDDGEVYLRFMKFSKMQFENKLASLEATLVRNYEPPSHWLTHKGKV